MSVKRSKTVPKVLSVCSSKTKHVRKKDIGEGTLNIDWGLVGDAHAAPGKRQVSLLAMESIEKAKKQGLKVAIGDFGENITTKGIDLVNLPIGQKLGIGKNIIVSVTQIGKECVKPCSIYYKTGDCIMPREGIFVAVLKGGKVKTGDEIKLIPACSRQV
jgi:MOSC domain-containing protein YiiM